jgi:hypothetical protein
LKAVQVLEAIRIGIVGLKVYLKVKQVLKESRSGLGVTIK